MANSAEYKKIADKLEFLSLAILGQGLVAGENFFERGDSLTAHILLASIEKEFGVKIEFSTLVRKPYIEDLILAIAEYVGEAA